MFAAGADVSGLSVATQAWNNKGTAATSGAPGSIGEVLSNVGVTVGFVHNHQKHKRQPLGLSGVHQRRGRYRLHRHHEDGDDRGDQQPCAGGRSRGESYAAPDSNTAASAAYYLADSLDDTATKILGGDSGAPVGFTGVELTASGEVEDLTIASGKTLIIAEDVHADRGHYYEQRARYIITARLPGEVLGGVVINYYDVTLDYGDGTVKVVTESGEFTLPTPEREGYSFLGWYDTAGQSLRRLLHPDRGCDPDRPLERDSHPRPEPDNRHPERERHDKHQLQQRQRCATITVTATPNSG